MALGKPRSATNVQHPPAGKACWSCWMSANVVARKRPLGQGYGMTAQPIGSVRPATTMPASQTSQRPRRGGSNDTPTNLDVGARDRGSREHGGLMVDV